MSYIWPPLLHHAGSLHDRIPNDNQVQNTVKPPPIPGTSRPDTRGEKATIKKQAKPPRSPSYKNHTCSSEDRDHDEAGRAERNAGASEQAVTMESVDSCAWRGDAGERDGWRERGGGEALLRGNPSDGIQRQRGRQDTDGVGRMKPVTEQRVGHGEISLPPPLASLSLFLSLCVCLSLSLALFTALT